MTHIPAEDYGTTVTNEYGKEINYGAAVNMMDDDLREQLHAELSPCTAQEFFDAYAERHYATFGEEWEPAKRNPQM